MSTWQVFRSTDDWFGTPDPAAFVRSEDEDGNVFTPAETVEADDESAALEMAAA